MKQALADRSDLLVEATCNQVNQFGGYTGMTPAGYVNYIHGLANQAGLPKERLQIGGDHLGPHVWRQEPADSAMQKALDLVQTCVKAGYRKIHLDAGMTLGGDPGPPLPPELAARRAAQMALAAEAARTPGIDPLYVIGAEAPLPGGSYRTGSAPAVTRETDARSFLATSRSAFEQAGLARAWNRVLALVVQPGVDFGDCAVSGYDRRAAEDLIRLHAELPGIMTYEIHSTDYQQPEALIRMVIDHFCILKTGPCLTHAYRESLFALSQIEAEWLEPSKSVRPSRLREALRAAMLADPAHWRAYYSETEDIDTFLPFYSLYDRVRYYWPAPIVRDAVERLMANFHQRRIPPPLLSQYLPQEHHAVREGQISADPLALIEWRIRSRLKPYSRACRLGAGEV